MNTGGAPQLLGRDEVVALEYCLLSRPVAAIPIHVDAVERPQVGAVQQLGSDTQVRVCGEGFNPATVLIETQSDGQLYVVFRADLNDAPSISSKLG